MVSGFKIKQYFVETLFNPMLFAFPYPKFLLAKIHSTFGKLISISFLNFLLSEFSTIITLMLESIEFRQFSIFSSLLYVVITIVRSSMVIF
jgi:hypothetical protein